MLPLPRYFSTDRYANRFSNAIAITKLLHEIAIRVGMLDLVLRLPRRRGVSDPFHEGFSLLTLSPSRTFHAQDLFHGILFFAIAVAVAIVKVIWK